MVDAQRCECGNPPAENEVSCEWCLAIEEMRISQTAPHTWHTARFTGTVTCEVCGLLPLDGSDSYSDCPGSATR